MVGFITQGRGISVHRADCQQIKQLSKAHPERLVPAEWGNTDATGFSITIRVIAQDYAGLLRDITTIIANEKINVLGVRSKVDRQQELSVIDIDLLLNKVDSLEKTIKKVKEGTDAISVNRL